MDAHVDDGELAIHLVLISKFCTLWILNWVPFPLLTMELGRRFKQLIIIYNWVTEIADELFHLFMGSVRKQNE